MKARQFFGTLAGFLLKGIRIIFFAWIKKREKKV